MTSTSPISSLDVSAFGAVNDGETDDTAAIQAATDYAIVNKLSLTFGPGTFLVSKPITIDGPTSWQGDADSTKIVTTGVNTLVTVLATSGVGVNNISFQGAGDNRSTANPLLVAYKADDLTLTGDEFSNSSGIGALLSNVNDTLINQCTFSHVGNEPDLNADGQAAAFTTDLPGYGSGNSVSNSFFSNIGLDAISATGQEGFTAYQNSIGELRATDAWRNEAQAPAGIYVNYDTDVTLSRNIIQNAAGNGIDVFNTQQITIDNNVVSGCGSSGIALSSTTIGSVFDNVSVDNNALQAWLFNAAITVGDHPGNVSSSRINVYSNTVGNTGEPSPQPYALQLYNVAPTGSIGVYGNTFVGSGIQEVIQNASGLDSTDTRDGTGATITLSSSQSPPTLTTAPFSLLNDDPLVDPAYIYAQQPALLATGIDPAVWYDTIGWHDGVNPNAYFDTNYYLTMNSDVAEAGVNPLQHYETFGWKEGRNPSGKFDTRDYLRAHPAVAGAAVDPLVQYLADEKSDGLVTSDVYAVPDPLVDAAYVYAHNPEVALSGMDASTWFDTVGWREGANPDALFDTSYYLKQNPDVAQAGINPLKHFEEFGWREGREPSLVFSDTAYDQAYPDVAAARFDPLLHFVSFGESEGRLFRLSGGTAPVDPLVDASYYDEQLGATLIPAGSLAAQQAAFSYQSVGWKGGLNPDTLFNTVYYLAHNPDVAAAHVDPLLHYETFGWREGRNPSALFSTSGYLESYPDVRAAGVDPLLSYIQSGAAEGRNPLGTHHLQ